MAHRDGEKKESANLEAGGAETVWEPQPVAAEEFHRPGKLCAINRAPYDRVGGVLYKRAAHIQRVRYSPAEPTPDLPAPWQGGGETVVRWLFSEQSGTAEGLLARHTFEFMHDTTLAPGAATGQRAHPGVDELLYVVAGNGMLYHRSHAGSPVLARTLRPGDAVWVQGAELHSLENVSEIEGLRLIVVGLRGINF